MSSGATLDCPELAFAFDSLACLTGCASGAADATAGLPRFPSLPVICVDGASEATVPIACGFVTSGAVSRITAGAFWSFVTKGTCAWCLATGAFGPELMLLLLLLEPIGAGGRMMSVHIGHLTIPY